MHRNKVYSIIAFFPDIFFWHIPIIISRSGAYYSYRDAPRLDEIRYGNWLAWNSLHSRDTYAASDWQFRDEKCALSTIWGVTRTGPIRKWKIGFPIKQLSSTDRGRSFSVRHSARLNLYGSSVAFYGVSTCQKGRVPGFGGWYIDHEAISF
jgi:hypothetical protein